MIRTIDPKSNAEIDLVAQRMRATLVDVLGEERGGSMYTLDWLHERVRFHLDPAQSRAQIFLAETPTGEIAGHCIVRVEKEPERTIGLFSTTYIEPAFRRQGFANALLLQGEAWLRAQGMRKFVTYTDEANEKLIRLYEKHGYRSGLVDIEKKMISLEKSLTT